MAYGWTITRDHLYETGVTSDIDRNRSGTTGPSTIPFHLEAVLEGKRTDIPKHQFKMYDDDGILYYTGYGTWDPEDEGGEDALYGPVADFGRPNAGAVRITWTGHPEWEIS